MSMDKRADNFFWGLKTPALERLVRTAPSRRQRTFAIACARLAARVAGLDRERAIRPAMLRSFEAAESLVNGVDPHDSRVVAARAEAEALALRLDEIHLQMHGQIMEDTEAGRCSWEEHPGRPAYTLAILRHAAVEAVEQMLHEEPLEAAAQTLEILHCSIRTDYETQLALARFWLVEPAEPFERDEVWPIFRRFPDE